MGASGSCVYERAGPFPRAPGKRTSGQMERFTVFQLPGTQNENNATAISAGDPSPATIISTVNRWPSS